MFRWSGYALSWLGQITFLFALGYVAAWWHPALGKATWFLAIWAFALPLFGGMAFLGTLILALSALKAKFIGPNPMVGFADGINQA